MNQAVLLERMRNLEIQERELRQIRNEIEEQLQVEETNERVLNEEADKIVDIINREEEPVQMEVQLVKNTIITSPTQMGKTKYIIRACKKIENEAILIVISCDNSLAQLAQLNSRLEQNDVLSYTLKGANPHTVCDHLNSGKSVVLTMINNVFAIQRLQKFLLIVQTNSTVVKHVMFHDEADTLNKADTVEDIANKEVAMSHRTWIQTFRILENSNTPVKRFWVSATPENCSNISRIEGKDIFVLPRDNSYTGVTEHVSWDYDEDDENEELLSVEIERIRNLNNGEFILYCVDKKNTDQSRKALSISRQNNCVTCCHNMMGSSIFVNGDFIRCYPRSEAVCDVLEKIKNRYSGMPLVVVGYNIMNRGISFVSTGENPIAATVMFYTSSERSHIVGIAQRFGRICGTARSDLSRRVVYCSDKVYGDYSGYISNQNKVWESLDTEENQDRTICSILSGCENVTRIKRPLDRPALKQVNLEYSNTTTSSGSNTVLETDEDKMKRHVRRWKNQINQTGVAKLFRDIVENSNTMENSRVKTYFETIGPYNALTNSNRAGHNTVFRKDETFHYIKQEALEYYNTL
jgi:hypothetical protein